MHTREQLCGRTNTHFLPRLGPGRLASSAWALRPGHGLPGRGAGAGIPAVPLGFLSPSAPPFPAAGGPELASQPHQLFHLLPPPCPLWSLSPGQAGRPGSLGLDLILHHRCVWTGAGAPRPPTCSCPTSLGARGGLPTQEGNPRRGGKPRNELLCVSLPPPSPLPPPGLSPLTGQAGPGREGWGHADVTPADSGAHLSGSLLPCDLKRVP